MRSLLYCVVIPELPLLQTLAYSTTMISTKDQETKPHLWQESQEEICLICILSLYVIGDSWRNVSHKYIANLCSVWNYWGRQEEICHICMVNLCPVWYYYNMWLYSQYPLSMGLRIPGAWSVLIQHCPSWCVMPGVAGHGEPLRLHVIRVVDKLVRSQVNWKL